MKSQIYKKSTGINKLYTSSVWRNKIVNLLTKILKYSNAPKSVIVDIISSNKMDETIFIELSKLVKTPENFYSDTYDFKRASYKWDIIKKK
jgi:hypothetical protein